uniref:Putative receptor protein kinase TMK1 n=1 Tax=Rhizophora mucronata TaxID=61149 RepID=A0A2P2PDI0_RHIMU
METQILGSLPHLLAHLLLREVMTMSPGALMEVAVRVQPLEILWALLLAVFVCYLLLGWVFASMLGNKSDTEGFRVLI